MPPPPIDILMTADMPTAPADAFDRRFRMHRLWQASDPSRVLATVAPDVRGIAAGGKTRIDRPFMDRLPNLEIIASFGVGYERVDVAAAAQRGLVVTNTPGVLTEEVADLALALLLATVRRIPQADRFVRDGRWHDGRFPLSPSLAGRKVGIVGLGRIGKAIARRCAAFGLVIAYHGRHRQPDVDYAFAETLLDLARRSDILILSTPGGAATERMIDATILDALGADGILINVARGSVVDEPALIAALTDKRILAAGLDVFAAEPAVPPALVAMDNVVLLPHVGSSSLPTWQAMSGLVLDNLTAWFEKGAPLTPVPETPWPKVPFTPIPRMSTTGDIRR